MTSNARQLSHDEENDVERIQRRIEEACLKAGRAKNSVNLIAVSKGQSVAKIKQAYDLGVRDFGENYVQEWVEKSKALSALPDLRWHFIGHLQSNKAKVVAADCYSIDSIDRQSVAELLERNRILTSQGKPQMRILVQLRVDETDPNKSGVTLKDAAALCKFLAPLVQLGWAGFMGIGPADTTDDQLRVLYKTFVESANDLWQRFAPVPMLDPVISLGMSSDLEIAIAAGSTEVRIGSALFGAREKRSDK